MFICQVEIHACNPKILFHDKNKYKFITNPFHKGSQKKDLFFQKDLCLDHNKSTEKKHKKKQKKDLVSAKTKCLFFYAKSISIPKPRSNTHIFCLCRLTLIHTFFLANSYCFSPLYAS